MPIMHPHEYIISPRANKTGTRFSGIAIFFYCIIYPCFSHVSQIYKHFSSTPYAYVVYISNNEVNLASKLTIKSWKTISKGLYVIQTSFTYMLN